MRILVLVTVAALVLPAAATAATRHGITPLAPKAGGTIRAGERPTFRARVAAQDGAVWVYICKSPKRNADGIICGGASVGRGVRKAGKAIEYRPKVDRAANFWLNVPGTYYWQVSRIDCAGSIDDCHQEGPVTKVVVR
jgi:hypothetical protein